MGVSWIYWGSGIHICCVVIGCILLSVGQDEFHGEVLHTLKYVVNQSDYTVQILNNVTQYLSLAKTINVAELFFPSNVITDTDKLNIDLNAVADTLTEKTDENAVKIRRVFNAIGIDLRGSSDANFGPAWSFVVCSRAPTCHSHCDFRHLFGYGRMGGKSACRDCT